MDWFGPNTGFYVRVVAMGAIAGFTIFLGLPLAYLRGSPKTRIFLNAFSVGILLYLFVEMAYLLIEDIEIYVKLYTTGLAVGSEVAWRLVVFLVGFTAGLMAPLWFEMKFLRSPTPKPTGPIPPRRMVMLIAIGIGLHNFSEGLVIGQSFLTGALSLGYTLVIGFALHNATEGFGLVAPIAGTRPGWRFLMTAGLVAGGPTFIGTLVGVTFTSAVLELLFMAVASGAILYIVGELIHLGRGQGGHFTTLTGLLVGFYIAFGTDLVVERAMTRNFVNPDLARKIEMEVGEYYFKPRNLELYSGELVALELTNMGNVDHEIEILGLGERTERIIPAGKMTTMFLQPHRPGTGLFICDMPGHLGGGMWGRIRIRKPSAIPPSEKPAPTS